PPSSLTYSSFKTLWSGRRFARMIFETEGRSKCRFEELQQKPADEGGMMRKISVRPTLTLRGRTFKGLRGWSGKPTHPPLTDFPVVGYVLGAAFDVISVLGGNDHGWAREFWHAGTYTFIGG